MAATTVKKGRPREESQFLQRTSRFTHGTKVFNKRHTSVQKNTVYIAHTLKPEQVIEVSIESHFYLKTIQRVHTGN